MHNYYISNRIGLEELRRMFDKKASSDIEKAVYYIDQLWQQYQLDSLIYGTSSFLVPIKEQTRYPLQPGDPDYVSSNWVYFPLSDDKCKDCGKELTITDSSDPDSNLCVTCYYLKNIKPAHIPKCECGAVKAGDKYHSRWCALYVDPMAPRVIK